MNYYKVCPKCGHQRISIPTKKIDSIIVIEYYCKHCDESQTKYEDINKLP